MSVEQVAMAMWYQDCLRRGHPPQAGQLYREWRQVGGYALAEYRAAAREFCRAIGRLK